MGAEFDLRLSVGGSCNQSLDSFSSGTPGDDEPTGQKHWSEEQVSRARGTSRAVIAREREHRESIAFPDGFNRCRQPGEQRAEFIHAQRFRKVLIQTIRKKAFSITHKRVRRDGSYDGSFIPR